MSAILESDSAAKLTVRALLGQRRHLGIWLLENGQQARAIDISFSIRHGLKLIDLLVDLMPQLTDASEKPLGVFDADALADWLLRESYKNTAQPLLVKDLEPLLATFGKLQTVAFFRRAKDLDPRAPVILLTHLCDLISAAGFPTDRIWTIAQKEDSWRMH